MSSNVPNAIVQTENLWKTYETGSLEYTALRGLTLSISKGEFVSIVGPSGSGKTTFLNLVGTLDRPTKGEITLEGVKTSKLSGDELARLRNEKLGFVFQFFNLIPYLTAVENVELPLTAIDMSASKRNEKAAGILTQLGLENMLDKKPRELSGGEQQRVAMARALVNDPPIILADEPTGNLDSKSAEIVTSLLSSLSQEKNVTIIMVTHNMEIANFSHRIVYLRDGSIEREVKLK
jgi:putative ABC transport system ATP-binding protein